MMELDTPTCERCGTPLIRYTRRYGVKGAYVKAQGWHHGGSVCAENVRAQRDALRDAAQEVLVYAPRSGWRPPAFDVALDALRAAVALTDRKPE
jgi:hypothetical protein